MDSYAQSRIHLEECAKDNMCAAPFAKSQSYNTDATKSMDLFITSDNVEINDNALGLAFSIAEHMTFVNAPTFVSLHSDNFTAHGSSKDKVWTCCYCGDSGMAVRKGGEHCPCGHERCGYCTVERARSGR